MTIEILDMNTIAQRIKSAVPALKDVQGAASLESALKSGLRALPTAFVIPLTEDAGRNSSGSQVVTQRITERFAIIIAAKDMGDNVGAKAAQALRPIRQGVMASIMGWEASTKHTAIEFDGGTLFKVNAGTIFWRDKFLTTQVHEI